MGHIHQSAHFTEGVGGLVHALGTEGDLFLHALINSILVNNVIWFHASGSEETRDELRMQVYDAMAEKETTHREDGATEPKGKMETTEEGAAKSPVKNGNEHFEPPVNGVEKTPEGKAEGVKTEEQNGNGKEVEEKMEEEGEGRLGIGLCLGAPRGLGQKDIKCGFCTITV